MGLHRRFPNSMIVRGVEGLNAHAASAVGGVGTVVPAALSASDTQARRRSGVYVGMGRASLVAVIAATWFGTAAADPRAARISDAPKRTTEKRDAFWTAPDACPTADQARAAVANRATISLDGVRVVVSKNEKTFVAQIHAGSTFFRTLTDRDCSSITTAVAIVIARNWTEISNLVDQAQAHANDAHPARPAKPKHRDVPVDTAQIEIDPPVSAADTSMNAAAPDGGSSFTVATLDSADVPQLAPIVRHDEIRYENPNIIAGHWGGGLGVIGLTGAGPLPGVNVGVEISTYLRRDSQFISVGGSRWVPSDQQSRFRTSPVTLDTAVVRAGWSPRDRPLRAWALGEAGVIRGAGNMPTNRWLALGGGFGVGWPMAKYARLTGSFEVALPLERDSITPEEGIPFRPGHITAWCAFGLEVGWR
ncbi:MAG TPA: hypothetical protein VGM90_07700 [Kofleriaceae bacterium]|jgi:hypothetical protein